MKEQTEEQKPLELAKVKLIRYLEKDMGRELTQQEINLVIAQAEHIGHL